MNQLRIVFPIPSKTLSPNSRPHWAAKAKAVKAARRDAHLAAMVAIQADGVKVPFQRATILAQWWFKQKRIRDDDNLLASLKAARDGLADAGVVANDNDLTWLPPVQLVDPTRKPCVVLIVTEVLA